MKAIWNNTVIAESDDTVVVEGNHYFPRSALRTEYLRPSEHHSMCFWKGRASYFDVVVDDRVNENAASPAASKIRDRVAFRHGVQMVP